MARKQVIGQALLTEFDLILRDPNGIHDECIDTFMGNNEEVLLNVILEKEKTYKSKEQLAYLYNAIGRRALKGYKKWGKRCRNHEVAVELLKLDCDYTETIVDEETGEILLTIPKSLSGDARMDEVYQFIHDAVIFVQNEMGIDVPTPDEWKKKKKWKR